MEFEQGEFQIGDKVFMMLSKECVGIGSVASMDGAGCCGGSLIGHGNASIFVEECLKHVELPYHTMDTTELQFAVWSAVRWPKMLLMPFVNRDSLPQDAQDECNATNDHDFTEPPHMDIQEGDKVFMMFSNECVGIGSVATMDATRYCGGSLIGQGNASIFVEQCLKHVELPFPTIDAKELQYAVWSAIRWPKMLLMPFENMDGLEKDAQKKCNVINDHDFMETTDIQSMPIISLENDIKIRESWKNKEVFLWDERKLQIVHKGFIMYVFPDNCVNFEQLGEECVGVALEQIPKSTTKNDVFDYVDSIYLVKWPIKQTTTLDKLPLQRYVAFQGVEIDNKQNSNEVPLIVVQATNCKKRSYTFVNRKRKSREPLLSNSYISIESVQRVSLIDCCKKKCCQFADRGMVMSVRQDYWGQYQETRTNYIYDILSTSWYKESKTHKLKYEFKLNGMLVCCRAWYEMHGIPKTSFYNHRKKFESGVRQHVHGNIGIVRRSLEHMGMARALLQEFVDNNSERMPNKSRTMLDGSRETQLVIPETYKQVDILDEINTTLGQLGYEKKLSKSSFNRIWNQEFPHVSLTKTSEFSKCSLCSSIKARLAAKPTLQERARIIEERNIHMKQQQSCRSQYYAWRTYSELLPQKYVCIIHDKMDQKKTAIPRLRTVPKEIDSAWQLQVALIGMITHGHGEGHYGHFMLNGLWPSDPNLTIGSIAFCLHNLERMDKHPLGDLESSGLPRSDALLLGALNSREALDYHNMSDGKEPLHQQVSTYHTSSSTNPIMLPCQASSSAFNTNSVQSQGPTPVMPMSSFCKLPENLLLQLDNCAGENKNRYLFAYLSLLVARGVFKTIQLGFLMVGHTHEDIDAMFSRFSEKLRVGQTFTLPHLMDTLRTSSTSSPAPFLLSKVPDFKKFCDGYLCEGQEALIGHSKPLLFWFFMNGETPIMQYKVHVASPDWKPNDGGICLWKKNSEGKPMLPHGFPPLLPMAEYVKGHTDVIAGIKAYVKFWEKLGNGVSTPRYYRPVIDYWNNVIQELGKPCISEYALYKDFWPQTQGSHQFDDVEAHMQSDRFLGIEELNEHYCGPQCEKPRDEFNPMTDVKQGDFVLLLPNDTMVYPIWLAMAISSIDMDSTSTKHKKILLQYWAPCARKSGLSDAEAYARCWTGYWVENKKEKRVWENADAIVWAFQKDPPFTRIKIPKRDQTKAQEGLGIAMEHDLQLEED